MPTGKSRLCHVNLLKRYYDHMSSSPSSKEAPCVKPALCVDTEMSSLGGAVKREGKWPTDEGVLQVRLKNSDALAQEISASITSTGLVR